MTGKIAQMIGSQAARKMVGKHGVSGGTLDLRGGMNLLRDRSIPIGHKLLALALGGALTWLLVALEAPLEGILALFVPFAGAALDLMIDGAEFLILPVIFAALMLPHLEQHFSPRRVYAEVVKDDLQRIAAK